ncbi:MAG: antibiotic biosynthesis monooxygenase [Desulfobulbus sp.]|jgi:heme-degrading monooxygenase HmoA|nr:antibiotic biosynthesis monooxygenase [Desulfobulbus sp.]MDR2551215.1 antibiotic biosynthesis monooxygenase [Desulfobulbus sp.]
MNNLISNTPQPPYYAVIFTSQRTPGDRGYAYTAGRLAELARTMPGFLGAESVRDEHGAGITVSYWQSEANMRHWLEQAEHAAARQLGNSVWYEDFSVRVARVERAYGKNRPG